MYITIKQRPKLEIKDVWEKILTGVFTSSHDVMPHRTTGTVTRIVSVRRRIACGWQQADFANKLKNIGEKCGHLADLPRDQKWHRFYIPKSKGGRREINEPIGEMREALEAIKSVFESSWEALYHTAAFAYVKGRSIKDAAYRHKDSNWFLKTDFSGFFPSINKEWTISMLSNIVPFVGINWKDSAIDAAMDLVFLDGGLPQGSPLSPMLTNIVMIPIDHALFNACAKRKLVYTRYADDICISGVEKFPKEEILQLIEDTLRKFQAPFRLKPEKTRYVTNKGANWNLGLMVNKDHKVTVGHYRKKDLKSSICHFIQDYRNGRLWDADVALELQGRIAYFTMVERDYTHHLVSHLEQKFRFDLNSALKTCIHPSV